MYFTYPHSVRPLKTIYFLFIMAKPARTARMYVLYSILLVHLSGPSNDRQVDLVVRKAAELLVTHQLHVHLFISFLSLYGATYAGFIADERSAAGAAVGVGDGEVGAGFRAL